MSINCRKGNTVQTYRKVFQVASSGIISLQYNAAFFHQWSSRTGQTNRRKKQPNVFSPSRAVRKDQVLGVPSRCRVLFAALGTRGRACMTCFGGRSPAPASSGHPLPPSLSLLQKEFFIFLSLFFFHLLQCNSHRYVASRMCKAQLTSDRAGFYNRHPPLTWQPHPRLLREAGKDLCPLDISRGQI